MSTIRFALSSWFVCVACTVLLADDPLRQRLDDKNGVDTETWVYNDIQKGIEKARETGKPLFITFRCVPCHDCAAFDADVANGNQAVKQLARSQFIAVRQVEMKGVDLSQFQFDFDLNWAAVFINADGTIYARYGTQSAAGADAYNSIDGLLTTMKRVLQLHKEYPRNRSQLEGKRPSPGQTKYAIDLPGIQNPDRYKQMTTRKNCIHCHNIHDAENMHAQETGSFNHDMLWRYPLPENIGLKIDRISSVSITEVLEGSPAAAAGLTAGQQIQTIGGQRIASIADIQWVLHGLPKDTQLEIVTDRGKHGLKLTGDWKKTDISWRGSLWSISPRMRVWMPAVREPQRKAAGLAEGTGALEVRWINRGAAGGAAAFKSGLRQGDVVTELNGTAITMDPPQFQAHVKLNYKVGDKLPLTVIRNKKRITVEVELVE